MAEAYYEPTPATDGASMNPVPGAVFQVFEISDTTFSTPLSLRVGAGNPTTTVAASDTLATLPGVYVTSPNFEHHWVSGSFVWRRDSIDGAKKAVESSAIAAQSAAANAATGAATELSQRIAAGEFKGKDGSNVLPTSQAIAQELAATDSPARAALNASVSEAKSFKGKNGQTFVRIDPAGEATQSIMELSPPAAGERVKVDFWSAPFGVAGRMRTMSIESHGTSDPYNPENNHNSIYTTNTLGEFVHVVDWDWGPTYDGLIHFPTMKLVAHQDFLADKNMGIGTRTPTPSETDARTIHMRSPVTNKPSEVRQFAGTVEGRMKTYSTKMFVGTVTAHETVLVAGGESNANLTLKTNGDAGFAKNVGVGTTSPSPATAGRRVLHINDAAGSEMRVQSGDVALRAVAAGTTTQFGADSAHAMTLYAGGIGNGQVRMGATGELAFHNVTPVPRQALAAAATDLATAIALVNDIRTKTIAKGLFSA